jgi:hypothetical protein
MSNPFLHLGGSMGFLAISLFLAWEKHSWGKMRLICLLLGIFWLPGITLNILILEKPGREWEWLTVSMIWLASILVLGLCLMYGSRKIHAQGRLMIILTLTAISVLLFTLIFYA